MRENLGVLHRLRTSILIASSLLAAAGLDAQTPQRGAVRGVVRSSLGDRIAYAVVALEPGFPKRFTNDSGDFAFTRVPPGTYRLLARQVGYRPLETTVVVTGDSTLNITLALDHLVIELETIHVTAELARAERPSRCTDPGSPDSGKTPALAAIFDQLRQNAERYWMLADSYPAMYRVQRRRGYLDRDSVVSYSFTDTLELRTDTRWRYAPGRLVSDMPTGHGGTALRVKLPTLPDLADSTFDANHCFRLVGLDTLQGETYVRVDFRPDERLVEPDADGSAYLDPITYLIQHIRIQLTHPDRAYPGLINLVAKVAFREIAPSLVLVGTVASETASMQGTTLVQGREVQRLLSVHFLRPLPRGQQ